MPVQVPTAQPPRPRCMRTDVESPIGLLHVFASAKGLSGVWFDDGRAPASVETDQADDATAHRVLEQARDELSAYFAGDLVQFDVPLDLLGTPFQQRVWNALLEIPAGSTSSYGALANRIGSSGAQRAVGAANGANPVSIIVPCHRVLASDGTLHGYGGGLWRKEWLLEHERGQGMLH